LRTLLATAWLRRRARALGIARLDAGPKAAAARFRGAPPVRYGPDLTWHGDRLVLARASQTAEERLAVIEELIEQIER
jgi:hypothetical protein